MYKNLITYLLILILLSSVAIPTYFSITEEICETSLVIDIEEDTDGNEKTEKSEVKIIAIPIEFSSFNTCFFKKNINSHQSDQYNSVYRKLELPPPENC